MSIKRQKYHVIVLDVLASSKYVRAHTFTIFSLFYDVSTNALWFILCGNNVILFLMKNILSQYERFLSLIRYPVFCYSMEQAYYKRGTAVTYKDSPISRTLLNKLGLGWWQLACFLVYEIET